MGCRGGAHHKSAGWGVRRFVRLGLPLEGRAALAAESNTSISGGPRGAKQADASICALEGTRWGATGWAVSADSLSSVDLSGLWVPHDTLRQRTDSPRRGPERKKWVNGTLRAGNRISDPGFSF
ncbi:hypothetical protein NDU88_012656 [Pleurodeles waltl]|uniref:Uncharacterized protein n=1 Tax=Pleurodeles waltl TaxID=8319 RepID=A0AAV7R2J3_PLEWA|nr:hypothetical protein NDU88_012656 [Pleurodeles waltl]